MVSNTIRLLSAFAFFIFNFNSPVSAVPLTITSNVMGKDSGAIIGKPLDLLNLPLLLRQSSSTGGSPGSRSTTGDQWVKDQYKDLGFDRNGHGEHWTGFRHPIEAIQLYSIEKEAFAATKRKYPGSRAHNNEADAFRHTYFNARATQELGRERAKAWGDAHERTSPNPVSERIMDLNNNRAGRQIGMKNMKASKAQTVKAVIKSIKSGKGGIMTNPPRIGGGAGGSGDPHFTGFDGSSFKFDGENRKHYLLFGHRGGDTLVSTMRSAEQEASGEIVRHRNFFKEFGLQVGESGSRISISLEEGGSGDLKWNEVVKMDGKSVISDVEDGPVRITLRPDSHSVTVTTNENMFTFRALALYNEWNRHLNFAMTMRSRNPSGGYLGILGMTVNKAAGVSVHADFGLGWEHHDHEMNLRHHFEVDSLFPDTNLGSSDMRQAIRTASDSNNVHVRDIQAAYTAGAGN